MNLESYRAVRRPIVTTLSRLSTNRKGRRGLQIALVSIRGIRSGVPREELLDHYRELCYRYLPLDHDDENSLPEALAEIARREARDAAAGATVFPLVKDVEHWHRYGIRTARQLWDYLEVC